MYNKIYNLLPITMLMKTRRLSERKLAMQAGISRLTLRSLLSRKQDSRLSSWSFVAASMDYSLYLVTSCSETQTDCSIQAVGYKILADGEQSWKIHLMEFVDEFRRSLDTRLIMLPPSEKLSRRIQALIRSTVYQLSLEAEIDPPEWSKRHLRLEEPWFVSESEALKPMMILESPLAFRQNNIFVGENFLSRV